MKMVLKRSLLIIGVIACIIALFYLIFKTTISLHEAFGPYSVVIALLCGLIGGGIMGTALMAIIAASGSASRDEEFEDKLFTTVQDVKEKTFKKGYEAGMEDGKAQENEEWNKSINLLTNRVLHSGQDFDRALAEEYFANKHLAEAANG